MIYVSFVSIYSCTNLEGCYEHLDAFKNLHMFSTDFINEHSTERLPFA